MRFTSQVDARLGGRGWSCYHEKSHFFGRTPCPFENSIRKKILAELYRLQSSAYFCSDQIYLFNWVALVGSVSNCSAIFEEKAILDLLTFALILVVRVAFCIESRIQISKKQVFILSDSECSPLFTSPFASTIHYGAYFLIGFRIASRP